MNHLLREEILMTKLLEPHNVKYIQRLQRMSDKENLDIYDFNQTGTIMTREDYQSYHHHISLHKKCTDVIRYIGGHYIQMLSDGNYLIQYDTSKRGKRSKDLKKLEQYLFKIISKNEK